MKGGRLPPVSVTMTAAAGVLTPQTYMTMQCPLWIIAEDAATGRRLWITQEGPRFSISIRRMDEQRHNYGPTYRITCENRTKLAQVLRYQFESKTLAV